MRVSANHEPACIHIPKEEICTFSACEMATDEVGDSRAFEERSVATRVGGDLEIEFETVEDIEIEFELVEDFKDFEKLRERP